jgi:hypothetical protein
MSNLNEPGRGELLAEVRTIGLARWLVTALGLTVSLPVVFLTAMGRANEMLRKSPPEPEAMLFVCYVIAVLAGAIIVWVWRQRLRVYSEGVAQRGLFSEKWLAYADVVAVFLTHTGAMFRLESGCEPWRLPFLRSRDGRGIGFRGDRSVGFMPVGEVLSAMYRALHLALPLMGERALETLRAGGEVTFGTVRATWQGLQVSGRSLAWEDVSVHFGGTGLHVYVRNCPGAALELPGTTPNQYLLVWLAQRMPALVAIRAITELAPPRVSPAATANTPVEPVAGFPDQDTVLGQLLCGQAIPVRRKRVLLAMTTWFAALCPGQLLLPSMFAPGVVLALAWALVPLAGLVVAIGKGNRVRLASVIGWGLFMTLIFAPPVIQSRPFDLVSPLLSVTLPCLSAVLALGALVAFINAREEGFAVYENGLRNRRRRICWENVLHLTRRGDLQRVWLRLEGTTGDIKVTGTDAATQAACQMIVARALPPLFQRVWTFLGAGREWSCAGVRVTREGLMNGGVRVVWEKVYNFKLDQGWLWLWIRGQEKPFFSVSLGERDALVLLSLLEAVFRSEVTRLAGLDRFPMPRYQRPRPRRAEPARPADAIQSLIQNTPGAKVTRGPWIGLQ